MLSHLDYVKVKQHQNICSYGFDAEGYHKTSNKRRVSNKRWGSDVRVLINVGSPIDTGSLIDAEQSEHIGL